jgi:adenylate kinase family enzyme
MMIVGAHSSGKTTLAHYLANELGVPHLEMGDVVRREARRRGEDNLVLLAEQILSQDPTFIARIALNQIHALDVPAVILVGPRTHLEFSTLIEAHPFLTVGIETNDVTRHRWWLEKRLEFNDTWEDRESREKRWQTHELAQRCNLVLDGQSSPQQHAEAVTAAASGWSYGCD